MHLSTSMLADTTVEVFARSFSSDVTTTAQSFKSWDTCQQNKTCKIISIVGIAIAAFVVLWFLFAIMSCICMGKQLLEACCCCCCRSANSKTVYVDNQSPYNNPNMYQPTPAPHFYQAPAPAAPAHFANQNYQGYQPVHREINDENPFSDSKAEKY
ncbi:hypothetical protein CAAN1_01S11694 [[Candida] anglica]|uniref:Uncharacterized protein n=1 Tax=[Candida] anglica TaxID=148631 RepID=A0ABP0EKE3_9ASCO